MSLLQRIFRRPDYRSDVTQFIEQLKTEKPDLEAQQRAGRSIWWDKNLDREALAEWKEAGVPQKPYVYGDDPRLPR
ncbi:MAG: hypothetical protein JWQ76_3316 [Ramlibacter sp.]|nr:hypothetical protein [Ramlibacter sp.]